jgi:hypothetical protein
MVGRGLDSTGSRDKLKAFVSAIMISGFLEELKLRETLRIGFG